MARARNIKPGFFTNDKLGELHPLARLLFAGLWTICDRAGRVEDRPKKIQAEVLPYDKCNADKLLQSLHDAGFIRRYAAGGKCAIQVLQWDKHQNPHMKEAESTIQAPGEHGASTVQALDEAQPFPALARLIPDSGFLIPESNTVPNGTAGVPPALEKPELWKVIKDLLQRAGVAKSACGGVITDLIAKHTEPVVMEAMQGIARTPPPGDIREYLPAVCQHIAGLRRAPNRQEILENRNRAVGNEWADATGEVHEAG